jgi:hypothetical protein
LSVELGSKNKKSMERESVGMWESLKKGKEEKFSFNHYNETLNKYNLFNLDGNDV